MFPFVRRARERCTRRSRLQGRNCLRAWYCPFKEEAESIIIDTSKLAAAALGPLAGSTRSGASLAGPCLFAGSYKRPDLLQAQFFRRFHAEINPQHAESSLQAHL